MNKSIDFFLAQRALFGTLFQRSRQIGNLLAAQMQSQCRGTMPNSVAPGDARTDIDITCQPKISRVEYFIRARIVQHSPGMHPGPVRKRARRGDRCIEGNRQTEALRHETIKRSELSEIIGRQQFWVMSVELSNHTTQRGNAVALAYPQHAHIQAVSVLGI